MVEEELVRRMRQALTEQRAQLRREIKVGRGSPIATRWRSSTTRASRIGRTARRNDPGSSLGREARTDLVDVERALQRTDTGTYGTCEWCGNPIDPERLEALPWAVLCIDCKQKR